MIAKSKTTAPKKMKLTDFITDDTIVKKVQGLYSHLLHPGYKVKETSIGGHLDVASMQIAHSQKALKRHGANGTDPDPSAFQFNKQQLEKYEDVRKALLDLVS